MTHAARRPRIALLGFLAALIAVHAISGWWQPIQADDWEHVLWAARHDGGWFTSHLAMSEAMGYALTHSAALQAAVAGLAAAAVVLGAFTVAMRRLPRPDDWGDTLGVVAVSALIWIATPRAGFVWFHRGNVAWHVCGCAVALWLLAPFRCGWRIGRVGAIALVAAGWLAGTSSRQIALAALVGMAYAIRCTTPRDRARWMWLALAGLAAGAIAGFARAPYAEPLRIVNRGLEPTLTALDLPARAGGRLVTLVLLLVLARLVIDAVRGGTAAVEPPPPHQTRAWLVAWLAICVACLIGPRYSEATLLPATLALILGALPYGRWLCATREVRWAIVAIAIGAHAVAWPIALTTYARLGGEFRDRMERLARTPPGSIATIAPYSDVQPGNWAFGEDLGQPSRQLIAIELFGARDIEFSPRFGRLEDNPQIDIALETDGLTQAQLRSASPAYWATDAGSARDQFEAFVDRAERAAGPRFTARLVARFEFAHRNGRPLLVAWYDRGSKTAPRVTRSNPDPNDRQRIALPAALADRFPEAYLVRGGAAEPLARDGAAYYVQSLVAGLVAVVACDPERCLLVDAFVPRF